MNLINSLVEIDQTMREMDIFEEKEKNTKNDSKIKKMMMKSKKFMLRTSRNKEENKK